MSSGNQICEHYQGYDEQCPHAEWMIRFYDAANVLMLLLLEICEQRYKYSMARARGFAKEASRYIDKHWGTLITEDNWELADYVLDSYSGLNDYTLDSVISQTRDPSLMTAVDQCLKATSLHFGSPGTLNRDCGATRLCGYIAGDLLLFVIHLLQANECIKEIAESIEGHPELNKYGRLQKCKDISIFRRSPPVRTELKCAIFHQRKWRYEGQFPFISIPNNNDSFQANHGEKNYYIRELLWQNNIVTSRVFGVISLKQDEAVILARLLKGSEIHYDAELAWETAAREQLPKTISLKEDELSKAYMDFDTTATFLCGTCVGTSPQEFIFGLPSNDDMTNLNLPISLQTNEFDPVQGAYVRLECKYGSDMAVLDIILTAIKRIRERLANASSEPAQVKPALLEDGVTEDVVSNLEAEENQADDTGQDEELAAIAAKIKICKCNLNAEQIAEMYLKAKRFTIDDEAYTNQGRPKRNHFWHLLKQKGCGPANIRDIWNGLARELGADLGSTEIVDAGPTGRTNIAECIKRHEKKLDALVS